MPYLKFGLHCDYLRKIIYIYIMKIYQFILLFLLILVPLMAIIFILSYKMDNSFDISSVKCIALTASVLNLFLSILLLINYDFDVLGYQLISDVLGSTSFANINKSNINYIDFIER